MKRILRCSLAWSAMLLVGLAGAAFARPAVNGATIETRTFNDCALSTLTTTNNYPALVEISDTMSPLCVGFANLHSFSFSEDGGATAAVFNNNSNFHFGADVTISGAGEGEGGLRISPWYGKFVDGRFMLNATSGEIACFGGALPFYSFTGNHGVSYTRGTTAHMEITYVANDLTSANPATIQYRLVYNNVTYDSPVIPFGEQNPNECNPNGLWGMLNDGRVGGYFQPRANSGENLTIQWANITYEQLPPTGTPAPNAAVINERTFNDCALSTLTTVNNYPASISISDAMSPLCVGFANLHSWSFSEDGGATAAVFDNNAIFTFGADLVIDGAGEGEGGLRVSPWYGQYVDGRFMANVTTGEIAVFGGALPFYSFTGNHGISYVRGTSIRFEITYDGNENISTNPATAVYRVIYNGNTYESPVIPFGEQNPNECNHGLWGMLNDGRVGGYFQPRANTGAELTATWSNITFSQCLLNASLEVKPSKLNLKSKGKWVTAYIRPEPPATAYDVDLTSLELNGVPADPDHIDIKENGALIKAKFDRQALQQTLTAGTSVSVRVTGTIGKDCFDAVDYIKVKAPHMNQPAANQVLAAGSQIDVAWTDADDIEASRLSLIASFDNGETWTLQATNIENDGLYRWTVPNVYSSQVHLALVTVFETDATGYVNENEVSASGPLTIASSTGVGGGPLAFALRKVAPNPARGSFNVEFSLPSSASASLRVFDVAGRQVIERPIGMLGPGSHSVTIGNGALRPGLYLVKLTQGKQSVTNRVLVIQ